MFEPPDSIVVKRSAARGLGVFARRPIAEGEVIERAPVIVVPTHQAAACSPLGSYGFVWSEREVALTLGFGSLYNHSYEPNAVYEDKAPRTKVFVALRDIDAGEEIMVNYNGEPGDRGPVGFDVL